MTEVFVLGGVRTPVGGAAVRFSCAALTIQSGDVEDGEHSAAEARLDRLGRIRWSVER
jgi:hypothetical protein